MTARVDLDDVGMCYPLRDGDPENHLLKARNLAVMWRNFEAVGARCLVASGTVENRDVLAAYKDAIPAAAFTLCRLRVGRQEQRDRILQRGHFLGVGGNAAVTSMTPDRLDRLAHEAAREADELDRNDIADFCIDTDGLDVPTVARLVVAQAGGWPHKHRVTRPTRARPHSAASLGQQGFGGRHSHVRFPLELVGGGS